MLIRMETPEIEDETDFHLPTDVSWGSLKQWFKAIYSRLISLKECMGNDVVDMHHPQNYWHHNQACQEYINQLKRLQREVDTAIDLARGTYFDKDYIKIRKTNTRFTRFKPYEDVITTTSNPGDRVLPDRQPMATRATDSS